MELGMIGLGRMGMNMARRLLQAGHTVAAYNRSPEKTRQIAAEGARDSFTIEELVGSLASPKIIWRMLPAGKITQEHIAEVAALLEPAFEKDPNLTSIRGIVDDSGEGRWTVQQAVESGVSAPVIASALFRRFESREKDAFENRVLAAMRHEFGGHAVVDSVE